MFRVRVRVSVDRLYIGFIICNVSCFTNDENNDLSVNIDSMLIVVFAVFFVSTLLTDLFVDLCMTMLFI